MATVTPFSSISVHKHFTHLSPPNATSLTQPMDMGVIKVLKTKYRSQLVTYVLSLLENEMPSLLLAVQISAKVDLLAAIQMVAYSWRQFSPRALMNCFEKYGFRQLGTEEGGEAEVVLKTSPTVTTHEQFIKIDKEIKCFFMCEPKIVDGVVQLIISENSQAAQENGSEHSHENGEEALPLSKKRFLIILKKLDSTLCKMVWIQDRVLRILTCVLMISLENSGATSKS